MKTTRKSVIWISLMALLASLVSGSAATISLRPVADTTLFEKFPTANLGGASTFVAGTVSTGQRSRGLVEFNVRGSVPANATITSVTLTLRVTDQPATGAVGSTYDLHRVLQSWSEGTKTSRIGSPASAGETTWNDRSFSLVPWSSPGGQAGTDFAALTSATRSISVPGTYVFVSTPNLVADVQSWLDNPSSNFGWILSSESEGTRKTAKRFGAREDPFNAPTLSIQFTPVPEPNPLLLLTLGTACLPLVRRGSNERHYAK